MFLNGTMLKNVNSVNSYQTANQVLVRQGNPATIYFQLNDEDQMDANGNSLRYMPATGSSITVSFNSISPSNAFSRAATQPFPQDTSIWSVAVIATDFIAQGSFTATLTEGVLVRTFVIENAIQIQSTNTDFC